MERGEAMNRRVTFALFLGIALIGGRALSVETVPKEIRDAAQIFTEGLIVVKGIGAAPTDRPLSSAQKEALALRAAKIVALRELGEIAGGIRVAGDSSIADAAAASDQIRGTMDAFIRGAEVIHESYDDGREKAVVYVRLSLNGPNSLVENLLPKIMQQKVANLPAAPAYKPPPAEAPHSAPQPVDSLIIDATGKNFRPALINRIVAANGSVLFEPSKIAPEILAKKGCGDYTSDVGKAKAILASHGANNPMVVTIAAVQRSTDAQVGESDAATIFAANQRTNFLESAKVVFVL
jgi:hypothetical protein